MLMLSVDAYAIGSIGSFGLVGSVGRCLCYWFDRVGADATGLLPAFFFESGAYATGFFLFRKSKYNY
jgi:hypothetical protein